MFINIGFNIFTLIFTGVSFFVLIAIAWFQLIESKKRLEKLLKEKTNQLQQSKIELEKQYQQCQDSQRQLNQRINQYSLIANLSQKAIINVNIEILIDEVIQTLCQTLNLEFSQVLKKLPNQDKFLLQAGMGWQKELIGNSQIETINNEATYTLENNQPLIIQDLTKETRFQPSSWLQEHNIVSGISTVIPGKETPWGILAIYSTTPREFSQEEIEFVSTLSQIISAAIHRHQEEEKLYLLERAINATSNGIIITDALNPKNPIIYVNSGFEKLTGFTQEEAIGKNCSFLQKGDKNQEGIEIIRKSLEEGIESTTVIRNYRKDGTLFWNQVNICPVFNHRGRLIHFIGVQKDMTEAKKAQEELELTRFSINHSQECVFWIGSDGKFVYVNDTACEALEYSKSQLLTMYVWDITVDYLKEEWNGHWEEIKKYRHFSFVKEHISASGKIYPVEINVNYIEFNGQEYNCAFARNISKTKEIMEALRESEERFRSIFEQAAVGIIQVSKERKFIELNQKAADFLGYSYEEMLELGCKDIVHPDTELEYERQVNLLLEKKINTVYLEKKFFKKNGSIVWGDVNVSLVRDSQEQLQYFIAVIRDITAQKQMEEALKQSEERFRRQYKGIPIPTYTWQRQKDNFILIDYNDAAISTIERNDYLTEELLGKTSKQIYSQLPEIQRDLEKCYQEKITIKKEIKLQVHQDNIQYWSVNYVFLPPNLVMLHLEDITNRKRMELELISKSNTLTAFSNNLKHLHRINTKNYHNIEELQTDLIRAGCEMLGAKAGKIYEIIGEKIIILKTICEGECYITNRELPIDQAIASLIRTKTTLESCQYELNLTINIATPIWVNHKIYGILSFESTDYRSTFQPYEREIVELMAQTLGKYIAANEIEMEREQAELRLRESQERLDSILSSLEDVIWSASPENNQLVYVNPAIEKVYGRSMAEFYQNSQLLKEVVHPDDRAKVEKFSILLSKKAFHPNHETKDIEYRILRPDGEERWIRDRSRIIYNEKKEPIRIDGIITDITKHKKAEQALIKSEEQFRVTFELAPIGMVITNKDGSISRVNQAFCNALGYTEEELMKLNPSQLTHYEDCQTTLINKQKLLTGESEHFTMEKRYIAKDGKVVYTILQASVWRDHLGQPIHIFKQIVDISKRKQMESQLRYDTLHDTLTGLPNRLLFMDRLNQAIKRCQDNSNYLFAVLFIDLDNFKIINDSVGHGVGDKLLKAIARELEEIVSSKDSIARMGGDEFTILLDNLKSPSDAITIAQKIIQKLNKPINLDNYQVYTSASIGIALSSIGYDNSEDIIRDADLTMYKAKSAGKGRYKIFDKKMHDLLLRRLQLEKDLRQAIEREEFQLLYQPIICLKTNQLVGFEGLIRWIHPTSGFISPGNFIPLAEETGLIIPIGEWVIQEACQQLITWQGKFPHTPLTISVNLSSRQLKEGNLIEKIDNILTATNLDPQWLKLEITETMLMENFATAKKILTQIQERKIKLSLDDFGTGYSSLSYLHNFPINTLKIDRSFVSRICKGHEHIEIIRTIVNLAHNLKMDCIAEGIESYEELAVLKDMLCEMGQGYLFAKPLKTSLAEDFIVKYGRNKMNNYI